jgi:hypothetical protein
MKPLRKQRPAKLKNLTFSATVSANNSTADVTKATGFEPIGANGAQGMTNVHPLTHQNTTDTFGSYTTLNTAASSPVNFASNNNNNNNSYTASYASTTASGQTTPASRRHGEDSRMKHLRNKLTTEKPDSVALELYNVSFFCFAFVQNLNARVSLKCVCVF